MLQCPAAAPRKPHPPALNPVTHWPLKRGQRLPAGHEQEEALRDRSRFKGAGFSSAAKWELIADNVRKWDAHRFNGLRGASDLFRSGVDPSADDLALLLWDLDLWRFAHTGKTLEEYLRPGREHWGWIGTLIRALALVNRADEEGLPVWWLPEITGQDAAVLAVLHELEDAEADDG